MRQLQQLSENVTVKDPLTVLSSGANSGAVDSGGGEMIIVAIMEWNKWLKIWND